MKKRNKTWFTLLVFLVLFWGFSSIFDDDNENLGNKNNYADTTFSILSSTENKEIEEIINNYAKKNKLDIDITYAGTLEMMDKLNQGEKYDAIWASNSIWLYMLNNSSSIKNSKSTSINPVVFGIKMSKAESLGFTTKDVYLKDILNEIKSGNLKFLMTSATQTNTGASAYLGFLTTLAGNPEILSNEHLESEQLKNDIISLLSGVERTSGSDEFLSDLAGSGQYDALVSYESSIIELNKKLTSSGKEPYYIIYPVDGVTISDSPLAYMDNGSDKKLEQFTNFQKYILSNDGQDELAKYGRRTWYGGVNDNVDRNVFNSDWGIDTNKYLVTVKYPSTSVIKKALVLYQTEFRKPTHTIFCLDYSGSMYGDGNEQLVSAMKYILDENTASNDMVQFSYKDKITIVPFDDKIWESFDTSDGTDTDELINQIEDLNVSGGTNIYGALVEALDILKDEEIQKYNLSIVLMTDGMGNYGTFSSLNNRYKSVNREIPIYSIMFGSADSSQLTEISNLSNGKVFDGRVDLLKAFKEVRGYN